MVDISRVNIPASLSYDAQYNNNKDADYDYTVTTPFNLHTEYEYDNYITWNDVAPKPAWSSLTYGPQLQEAWMWHDLYKVIADTAALEGRVATLETDLADAISRIVALEGI